MVCLLNLGVEEFNLMYIKKVYKVPPEIGLNMPSKIKDKKAKQFTCTIKGKTSENRCEVLQRKLKRNNIQIEIRRCLARGIVR